jgi:hypothetical protein
MSEIHITPALLEAVESGEIPVRVLTEIGWKHLMQLCPTCREGFADWQKRRGKGTAFHYDTTFRVLPWVLQQHVHGADAADDPVERDVQTLLRWPQHQRLAKIQRANARFKGVDLAHRLVNEARSHMPGQHQIVYELAEVAEQVLIRTPTSPGYWEGMVRARAYKANAVRASGQLKEAEARLANARGLLRQEQITEALVYAEIDAFEGVLRKDQRRFGEAAALLSRASSLFALIGEDVESAKPLLALGLMHYECMEMDQAIATTRAALALLNPDSEPRLYLCGRHNLTLFLAESGKYQAASALLQADGPLYSRFADPWTLLRQRWIAGKIAFHDGRGPEAEAEFLTVREGFLAQGIGYDAALASLDIALLFLREGRLAEVRRLAEEMHAVFEAQDLHAAALAALVLFQDAARRDALSAEWIAQLAAFLRRVRHNPEVKFQA